MRFSTFVLLLVALVSPCYADDIPDFSEGLWEITITTEMTGFNLPPQTNTQCMTKENFVPQTGVDRLGNTGCTMEQRIDGSSVSWNFTCDNEGAISRGTGRATYFQDRSEGEITIVTQGTEMVSTFEGRYLGPCP
jgi:hypothetical protein